MNPNENSNDSNNDPIKYVIALHDYKHEDTNKYICFTKGDKIKLIKHGNRGW